MVGVREAFWGFRLGSREAACNWRRCRREMGCAEGRSWPGWNGFTLQFYSNMSWMVWGLAWKWLLGRPLEPRGVRFREL